MSELDWSDGCLWQAELDMAKRQRQGMKHTGWRNLASLGSLVVSLVYLLGGVEQAISQTEADALPSEQEILQACASKQAANLPNPYTDLRPSDWYYEAVIVLHYCGAYRGAIQPEVLLDARQSQSDTE